MSGTKEQVIEFLNSCEELKNCKFIMATTKIKDLLKCIVNCSEIYRLFESVTEKFNYPAAKASCLVTVDDGIFSKSYVVLPKTVGHRLAFIFCLMVEFDQGQINFNDFLSIYFPEDNSYVASYRAFCNLIVKGLEDAITQVFANVLAEEDVPEIPNTPDANKANMLSAFEISLAAEIQTVQDADIDEGDKAGAIKILTQLVTELKNGNTDVIDALVCGYGFFLMSHRLPSENFGEIAQAIVGFEENL